MVDDLRDNAEMFKIAIPLLGIALVILVAIDLFRCPDQDFEFYQNLIKSSATNGSNENLIPSKHLRKNVHKKVWYQGKTPLQICMTSENSELLFNQHKHAFKVIEEMEKVNCWIQEELYFIDNQPMQRIDYIEAECATYDYSTQLLIANGAKIWKYEIEGSILPSEQPLIPPIMHAIADHVQIGPTTSGKLSGNIQVDFSQGGQLRGQLHCDSLLFNHHEKRALLFGNPQVTYCDEMGEVSADHACIDYQKTPGSLNMTKITLFDNVKLLHLGSEERPSLQYALANKVTYFLENQLLILENEKGRVLFFDQMRDVQLSAKTIHAQRDSQTKKESIRGIGDVRFILGPDELKKIKEHFHIK